MLEIQNLCAGYGRKEVVHDVNCTIKAGELTVLLGLNGCGKSTLIKAICGLNDVQSGDCKIGDSKVEDCKIEEPKGRGYKLNTCDMNERERAKLIAYIPQRGSFIAGMTSLRVVMMGFNARLNLFEEPSQAQEQAALETMRRLEIEELADRNYAELSEGQKQMVILARCLVQETPVMLMDEPDSALDYVNKRKILKHIKGVVEDDQKACLIALHDPNLALRYADRILMMRDGRIIHDFYTKTYEMQNRMSHNELGEKIGGQTITQSEIETYMRDIYGDVRLIEAEGYCILI